jgi:hypothetical protein
MVGASMTCGWVFLVALCSGSGGAVGGQVEAAYLKVF